MSIKKLLHRRFELSKRFDDNRHNPELQGDIARMLKAIDIKLKEMDKDEKEIDIETGVRFHED